MQKNEADVRNATQLDLFEKKEMKDAGVNVEIKKYKMLKTM